MTLRTRVLIAGAGPAGLVLAMELGRRGVPCIVLEEAPGPPTFPKANATTSRSMEHYRRLGFADEIRSLGLPEDHPQDIAYTTRFSGHEMARVRWPSRGEAARAREDARSRWPTPEPLHRTQQMFVQAVMKRHAEKWPSVDLRYGWRLAGFEAGNSGVTGRAESVGGGRVQTIQCDFLVGADGAGSLVRKDLGIGYGGYSGAERDFMGGRMLSVYFRSRAFYKLVQPRRAWQIWAVNREARGLICAIDGDGLWMFLAQLPRGTEPSAAFGTAALMASAGREFPIELLGIAPWTAGFALVAERYRDRTGRVFLIGDAAHLFTPTGGQGYNTAVDDAANLGWKLAAACQGWGGRELLATYESERKPIGHRNTGFARAMADSIGRMPVPAPLEEATPAGERARAELGARLEAHCRKEFDIPGIHFGVFYGGSPIVVDDGAPAPPDDWHRYVPHATPGARAPHLWVADGVSIFDRFGRDFTLLRLGAAAPQSDSIVRAAQSHGVPLAALVVPLEEARELYGADLALIRPDHHVAWRGSALPADPAALLARVTGAR